MAGKRKPSTCHPEKPSVAHGLCKGCYYHYRKSNVTKPSTCHPDRPAEAKGLCHSCYTALRLATSETQKQPCYSCGIKPRTRTTSYCRDCRINNTNKVLEKNINKPCTICGGGPRLRHRTQCRDCINKKQNERYHKDLTRTKSRWLKSIYGITLEEAETMLDAQGGKCAIMSCDNVLSLEVHSKDMKACVDHNHQTGAVRGILCVKCNSLMGALDSPYFMDLMEYKNKYE